jgi:acyl carrier protein
MTHEEVLARLTEILKNDFKVPPAKITPEATFRGTLGLDSLDAVDLIYLIGKSFGIKTKVESFADLHSVKAVADYIVRAKSEAA